MHEMRESQILQIIRARIPEAGDDAAIVPFRDTNLIFTTDMLHRKTDFPEQTTPRTIGWRSVAVSLSDLAAMGAQPLGVLLAFGNPALNEPSVMGVLEGASACCEAAGTRLLGGDLDRHQELTLVSTAIGHTPAPVRRSGAQVGDLVCITGELGRTQAALRYFETGHTKRANELFRFPPRVHWGLKLGRLASSMIDISDGLARSLHLLAQEGQVGFAVEEARLPVIPDLQEQLPQGEMSEAVLFGGEDYELLFTLPESAISTIDRTVRYSVIGRVTEGGVLLDEDELPDRGYDH
jgi:thiamine-monophosphate kinase